MISMGVAVYIGDLGAREVLEAGELLEDMEAADRELVAAGVEGADVGAGNDSISLKRHSVKKSSGGGKGGRCWWLPWL